MKYSVKPFQQHSISNTQKAYFTTLWLSKITKITPFALYYDGRAPYNYAQKSSNILKTVWKSLSVRNLNSLNGNSQMKNTEYRNKVCTRVMIAISASIIVKHVEQLIQKKYEAYAFTITRSQFPGKLRLPLNSKSIS